MIQNFQYLTILCICFKVIFSFYLFVSRYQPKVLPFLKLFLIMYSLINIVTNRGGVKDTRLKAKDTTKIRGQSQGQPFRVVVQIFVEQWGDNLQFYPNFALFSTLGDDLDQDCFQVSKLSEDQKKKFFIRNGTLFSPEFR